MTKNKNEKAWRIVDDIEYERNSTRKRKKKSV